MPLLDRIPLQREKQWHNLVSVRISGLLDVVDGVDRVIRGIHASDRSLNYIFRDVTYWMNRKLNKKD